ncbi:MAG: hypothetical protein B6I32_01075 [Desulfobacterium sp. 4572_20]|nr:MAG: hypothetical protein B6I32_01075 [Desulfobacterium sp. 4572_20]
MIVKKDVSFPQLTELCKDPQGWLEEAGDNVDLCRLTLEFLKRIKIGLSDEPILSSSEDLDVVNIRERN